MTIEVRGLTKRFGSFYALDDVSIEVPGGGLIALLGPSGSGKTTLLRILAGLEYPDRGSALIDGVDLASQSARQRNVGLVFQHYALFRHLDVFENIAFALRVRKRPRAEVDARVRELLKLIQLESLEKRLPAQLSGGQRQRVALARALAARPKVLLLDEPFGALDAQVRAELRGWLRRLHDEIHITTVFVTHDQDEAFEVADRVVVMNRGKIEQAGSPADVFEHPANDFVMRFLGHVNVLDAEVHDGYAKIGDITFTVGDHNGDPHHIGPSHAGNGAARLNGSNGAATSNGNGASHSNGANGETRSRIYVRPHDVEVARTASTGAFAAQVVRVTPLSGGLKVELSVPSLGSNLRVDLDWERGSALALRGGEDVFLSLRRARVFPSDGAATQEALS